MPNPIDEAAERTPEYYANKFLMPTSETTVEHLTRLFAEALTAACTQERERCAEIARLWLEQNIEDIRRGEILDWHYLLQKHIRSQEAQK